MVSGQLVVYAVMFFLFLYLARLEKKLPEIRAEIEARKAAEQSGSAEA